MLTIRSLFGGSAIEVEAAELPRGANRTPPPGDGAVPAVQNRVPSSVTALRMLFWSYASLIRVLVSTFPAASTRPTMRLLTDALVLTTLAVPSAASYPPSVRNCPFDERFSEPSEVADPLIARIALVPLPVVGRAIV